MGDSCDRIGTTVFLKPVKTDTIMTHEKFEYVNKHKVHQYH